MLDYLKTLIIMFIGMCFVSAILYAIILLSGYITHTFGNIGLYIYILFWLSVVFAAVEKVIE